jgi:hypothetical protein
LRSNLSDPKTFGDVTAIMVHPGDDPAWWPATTRNA